MGVIKITGLDGRDRDRDREQIGRLDEHRLDSFTERNKVRG